MPGRIRSDTVERVREATNIVDLIGAYVSLKRSGRNHKGLCPFHNEKSPSFSVMLERGRYHCFGCGQKGNVFDFIMAVDRLTFPEAVEILAEKAGIMVEREEGEERRSTGPSKQEVFRLNRWAAEFFRRRLVAPGGEACRAYLERRGISAASQEDFGIGYAPAGWDALVGAARKKAIPDALLLEAGLAKARESRSGLYDAFRDRLIFPIRDGLDRIIGFGGRSLDGSEPKYLNSPETPVFSKRRSLYGLDRVRGIKPGNPLFVMEGYTDVIMSVQAADAFAVATLGTALTEEHARLLSRYDSRVVLVYDGDSAGRRAAEKGAELFTSIDLDLEIALLPGGQDPCDFFSERGSEGMADLLGRARDFYGFVLGEVKDRHDITDINGRTRAADELLALARAASNPVKRDILIERIGADLGLGRPVLESRLRGISPSVRHGAEPAPQEQVRPVVPVEKPEPQRSKASRRAEKQVIEAVVNGAGAGSTWASELLAEDFSVGSSRALFSRLQGRALAGRGADAEAVLSDCDDAEERRIVNQLVADSEKREIFEQQLAGAIEHLRHERRQRELARAREEGVTEDNFEDMVARLREAKRKKRSDGESATEVPRAKTRPVVPASPVVQAEPEVVPEPDEIWSLEPPPDLNGEGAEDDLDFF